MLGVMVLTRSALVSSILHRGANLEEHGKVLIAAVIAQLGIILYGAKIGASQPTSILWKVSMVINALNLGALTFTCVL